MPDLREPDSEQEQQAPPVSDPAELIRLVSMLQALTAEVGDVSLDDAGRARLFDIHKRAVDAVKGIVSEDLEDELADLGLPLEDDDATGTELRMAQGQLLGWLNGLFQGIQAAVAAQQMSSARQLQQLQQQGGRSGDSPRGGQYL